MPEGLFDFQEVGALTMAWRQRFGLFDEPGVGKTCQTVRCLDHLNARRGIIICPAVARAHWIGEFEKFSITKRTYVRGMNIHDFVAWARGRFDVLIVSYELSAKWLAKLQTLGEPLDFMIFDEAHYLKNMDAFRSRVLLGIEASGHNSAVQWAKNAYWLTGTPIPNDPIDIYTFLRFVGAMPLDQTAFKQRYFHVRKRAYGTSVQRPLPEMLPELQELIRANCIRRTLAETGHELPPFFLTTTQIDGDTEQVRALLADHPGLDRLILEALEAGKPLSGLDHDHVATLRRIIGEAKALPYADMLASELMSGLDKMVVFGIHRKVLRIVFDRLNELGLPTALITGETNDKDTEDAIYRFQNDPALRVIACNIRKAGTARTFTAAAALDVLEPDWSPATNWQAFKRVHRFTQWRSVRGRFIQLAGSFDVEVGKIVRDKTQVIATTEGTAPMVPIAS